MESSKKYVLRVFVTGLLSFLAVSLFLFWVRWVPQTIFQQVSLETDLEIEWSPSGLWSEELENDPNVVRKSRIYVRGYNLMSSTCGMYDDFANLTESGFKLGLRERMERTSVYGLNKFQHEKYMEAWELTYFDKESGLFVYCELFKTDLGDKQEWNKKILFYAGPEGVSENPDEAIGRFVKPLNNTKRDHARHVILFDQMLGRLFVINFRQQDVKKGPEIADENFQPVRVGRLSKNDYVLRLDWSAPQIAVSKKKYMKDLSDKRTLSSTNILDLIDNTVYVDGESHYLVIDKTGRIFYPDFETLELKRGGYLPEAGPPFTRETGRPAADDLLAYRVLHLYGLENGKTEHKGIIAASLSREGFGVAVAVFDENGKLIKEERNAIGDRTEGSVAWAISKYLFENLQAPILGAASYFTGNVFEAASGHKALFVLPNSFVSIIRRLQSDAVVARFFYVLLLIMSPSVILSACLAWLIRKDVTAVGLSGRAKLYWTVGTILFGLSAYITYKLTKPKDTLVSCQNCGKMRRPDMVRCHRCGGKWHIPELTPPTWRVITEPKL